MKKNILILCLLFLIPIKVTAIDKKPTIEGNIVYANGYAITIKERKDGLDGATISWNNGSFNVDDSAIIFGGGKPIESYVGSNITMTGGTVSTIYGGGNGTVNTNSDVGTSYITIDGGVVTNAVYGGGRLSSTVTTSNIRMMSGNVNNILGGGGASSGSFKVGSYETMDTSPNHTINTNITISGGTISSAIYGGGQGYSHVDRTSILVSGNAEIPYLIGGGIDGRTDEIIIEAMGSNIKVMQSFNRGTIGNVSAKINGANINYLYTLGDNTDTSVTGKIDDTANIKLDITSGKINNLKLGINDTEIPTDTSKIYITYIDNTIDNIEEKFTNLDLITPTINPILDDVPKTGITKKISFETIILTFILGVFLKIKLTR